MYQNQTEERQFWIDVLQEALKYSIEAVSTLIINKLAKAMSGVDDGVDLSGLGLDKNSPFIQSLIDQGLSESDLMELKKEGVDLSTLTIGDYEEI